MGYIQATTHREGVDCVQVGGGGYDGGPEYQCDSYVTEPGNPLLSRGEDILIAWLDLLGGIGLVIFALQGKYGTIAMLTKIGSIPIVRR